MDIGPDPLLLIVLAFLRFGISAAASAQKSSDKEGAAHKGFVITAFITDLCAGILLYRCYRKLISPLLERLLSGITLPVLAQILHCLVAIVLFAVVFWLIHLFFICLPEQIGRLSREENRIYAFIRKLLTPFAMAEKAADHLARGMAGPARDPKEPSTEEEVAEEARTEIREIISKAVREDAIPEREAGMILHMLKFADTQVQDIMTHKQDIEWIEDDMTLQEVTDSMISTGFSRFPVRHKEDTNDVTDVLYFKDVMRYKEKHPDDKDTLISELTGLFRKALIVTETMDIDELFFKMQSTKVQMAVCIGEYGQTVGLVSMEDILEEIVGDINDEYDDDSRYIWPAGTRNAFVIDGGAPLEELEEFFKVRFTDDRVDTLNGYMITRMDRVPDSSEKQDVHIPLEGRDYRFDLSILSVKDHKIERALAVRSPRRPAREN